MSKFVSVNLNKSYGQPPSRNSASISGPVPWRNNAGIGRARPVNHGGTGSGMVVLSRPRSSGAAGGGMPKSGSRLSVPPPLNLPSLRKEHERLDPSSSTSGGSVGPGSQSGPASSGMGWTKPARIEKDIGSDSRSDGGEKGHNVYTPPAARSGMAGQPVDGPARAFVPTVDKAVLLRGEDFPSLQASLPSAQPSVKQKQKPSEEVRDELAENSSSRLSSSSLTLHMRPAMGSTRLTVGNRSDANGGSGHSSSGFRVVAEDSRDRGGHLPSPLPIVRFSHTSDWADDERDTSNSLVDRDRDRGFSKTEVEFDIPRVVPPRSYGPPDANSGKVLSRDIFKVRDLYGRDAVTPNQDGRDGSPWRVSSPLKDGLGAREIGIDRNGVGVRHFSMSKETSKDNKYNPLPYKDNSRDGFSNTVNGFRDSRYIRRDSGYGQSGQNGNRVLETYNGRGNEQNMRGRYGDLSNRYRGDVFQNSSMPKSSFSSGSKGLPLNDPILNFRREKGIFSNSGKPLLEDAFVNDSFSTGLIADVKVFKRKKDVLKQADFHDPVRESFEAELERVQKMQERERQRVIEEQARALELARKEEEERERLVREEEKRCRRIEEEAREAAVRAEQERAESLKRAEEQKMAREGERRRIFLEEERRKEAAKQKLLELEARIARRQAEATIKDEKFPTAVGSERALGAVKGRDIVPRLSADIGDWEDGERMVERITSSASSDSSTLNRSFDTGSRPHSSRDGSSSFLNRGKHTTSWPRDGFENLNGSSFLLQDQDNGYRSPRRDVFGGGRAFPRKEFYGGPGVISSRASSKGGMTESHMVDDFPHLRGHRWNPEMDAEFSENTLDGFGDIGWGHGRSRGSPNAPYADRFFQSSEFDGFSSFGRSRHSMRQPRVLPPPSLPSMHRSSFRTDSEHSGSLAFADSETRYQHAGRSEQVIMAPPQESTIHEEQKEEKDTLRCDSQSSLSVSSPPSSPTHLSHDDLDDSGDGEQIAESDNEHVALAPESGGNANIMTVSNSASPCEDEEWDIDNDEELQGQEEYDEEEDGYHEEDELHEGDDENLDQVEEFEDLNSSEEHKTVDEMHQLVLGFEEGVKGGMPSNDEIERSSKNGENPVGMQPISVTVAQDPGSLDELVSNGHAIQIDNNISEVETIHEPEKAMQDTVPQPAEIDHKAVASTSYLGDSVDPSSSSGTQSQQAVTSAVNMSLPPSLVQPILPTVSAAPSQSDIPVKLQFGLFSGPSLIPSPVPAIQIGSIQMPLHMHPQVGPSLSQMHHPQPPFFQFGQFRYTSPIPQGVLPLAPQTMSFVQPTVSTHYSLGQNLGGSLHYRSGQESSTQNPHLQDKVSLPENLGKEMEVLPEADSLDNGALLSQSQPERSLSSEKMAGTESASQVEDDQRRHNASVKRNYRSTFNSRESHGHPYSEFSSEKTLSASRAPGTISGSKGKRLVYIVRNSGSRSPVPASEASQADFNGFQRRARRNTRRTEFRVRENVDRRRTEGLFSSNHSGPDEQSNFNGRVSGNSTTNRVQKDAVFNKSTKSMVESKGLLTSGSFISRGVDSESKMEKSLGNEVPSNKKFSSSGISSSREGNLKKNVSSEEDVDAPLQSGVVRVFKQPGIEAPSDEDDFIEVRSKRQMLNDRREQREKEIKAKSVFIKTPRKPRPGSQSTVVSSNSNRVATSLAGEASNSVCSESLVTDGRGLANVEASTGFPTIIASQSLPPIGTPAVNDSQADMRSHNMKSLQRSSVLVTSSGGENHVPGLSFENKNVVVPTSLGSWANPPISQQVMALTQTQLDDAMKPARFDTSVASIGEHTTVVEYSKPSTSVSTHDKSFSSSTSPLSSLLAGEKIQFGAVTSPTILPSISRAVSNGIGPPCPCRSDVSSNLPTSENDRTYFDKDKNPDESHVHLEDPEAEAEAEAEAAASAVAVAAISSDELVGNVLGSCSVSVSDTKNFVGADVDGLPSGVTGNQQLTNQSRGEESLTVALPADLSVETPSLSLWQPLPSPQSSSCAMLSPFAGAPPSHFPCYEMNPMLGGPIFAFGPHEETNTQSPSQKSNIPGSAPLGGAWQQCHSGVDTSFYGPPAGFTGPFIGPSGGIPGVQGPAHMVVYNHFAPVGQFGQVGLSYMGATYIPSGKQPDWKHNPVSSAVGISDSDVNNLNMVSGQRNPHMQHLAPGSPLVPMPSPLAMFDMSPFQTSADIPPMQARWSHMPTSPPLHSVPLSMPLQPQQAEMGQPSQFSHGVPSDPATGNMFHEARSQSTTDNSGRNLPAVTLSATTQFPDELGLVDPTPSAGNGPTSYSSTNGKGKVQIVGKGSLRSAPISIGGESSGSIGGTSSSSNHSNYSSSQGMNSTFKTQASQQQPPSAQRYLRPIGYSEQRGGGVSQKMGSGGEWHHRKVAGFQGKNQSSGTEKNSAIAKVKQIYVAKPSTTGTSAV